MTALLSIIEREHDIVAALLQEQQRLTAVEMFSHTHDAGMAQQPAQERYYRKLMPATAPGPNQQFAFEVDLDACSGCKACVVACHTLNGLDEQETWRSVGTVFGDEAIQHVTTACHHCEAPGCLSGCPVKAYIKDDVSGIVRHLDDQCIGCKYCTMMCPYEVPQYSQRLGIVRKCDMCHQRLSVGEAPACVQSCPNEAIRIRIVDHTGEGNDCSTAQAIAPGAPPSSITYPTTRYVADNLPAFRSGTAQDSCVDMVADSHWPLAVMLVATQAAIGLLIAERVAAFAMVLMGESLSPVVTRAVATWALVVAAVGMNVAPLHLGQPRRAWRVFLGLGTSWLSREAVVLGGFMAILGGSVLLLWLPSIQDNVPAKYVPESLRSIVPPSAAPALLGLAIAMGIAGFYCSGMIYIATQRRLWRFSRTMLRFAGTLVVLGAAGFAFAASLVDTSTTLSRVASVVAFFAVLAKLWYETSLIRVAERARAADDLDRRSRSLVLGPLRPWFISRMVCGIVGVMLLIVAARCTVLDGVLTTCCGLAFAVLAGGEFAERYLYFASVVYDRMPGTLR